MARKKIKLAWITNDSARRATFKKRKKGLMKKVSELSTLCGVGACAIIFSPYDAEPEVWPAPPDAQRVLNRFKSLPEMEQCRKMMNQEAFLRQRIQKARDQLKKQQKDNRLNEITQLMNQTLTGQRGLFEIGIIDLGDLAWLVEDRIKTMSERMELLNLLHAPIPSPIVLPVGETLMNNNNAGAAASVVVDHQQPKSPFQMAMEALQGQSWFMEVMNPNENIGGGNGVDMVAPFGDANAWPNGFLP